MEYEAKLRHDTNSDIQSIFECCRLLEQMDDLPTDVRIGLELILSKRDRLEENINIIFSKS